MNIIKLECVPNYAELLEMAQLAQARHLHLITNGKRSVLCSIIPPGWKAMPVMHKYPQGESPWNIGAKAPYSHVKVKAA